VLQIQKANEHQLHRNLSLCTAAIVDLVGCSKPAYHFFANLNAAAK
jgi:hypothetical protein